MVQIVTTSGLQCRVFFLAIGDPPMKPLIVRLIPFILAMSLRTALVVACLMSRVLQELTKHRQHAVC
jgi:hypothetical protein